MMEILILILLTLSVIGICVFSIFTFMKFITDLNERIAILERNIDAVQYQMDNILHDIDNVRRNVIKTHELLSRMEDKNEND